MSGVLDINMESSEWARVISTVNQVKFWARRLTEWRSEAGVSMNTSEREEEISD